jgi:hypothetical protein
MATKYIRESEDKKFSGGGVRAMRRHGGTVVIAYGFKRRDFISHHHGFKRKGGTSRIFVPDMTRLKRCGFFGGAMSKRERLRRAKKKDSIYPIGDGENNKKSQELGQKKGPTMGLESTWVRARDWTCTAKNRKARAIKLRL